MGTAGAIEKKATTVLEITWILTVMVYPVLDLDSDDDGVPIQKSR